MRNCQALLRRRTVSSRSFECYIAAFPDLRTVPEDLIASGDKVVARVRTTGTHKGAFMGMSPDRQTDRRTAHRHHSF